MYELDVDEDVNRVLFALCGQLQLPKTHQQPSKGKKHSKQSAQASKQIQVDGSAAAVKLLKPRLAQLVNGKALQGIAALEAMLQNLSLVQ